MNTDWLNRRIDATLKRLDAAGNAEAAGALRYAREAHAAGHCDSPRLLAALKVANVAARAAAFVKRHGERSQG